jgi:hypothetical protein
LGPDPRRALGPAASRAARTGRTHDRTDQCCINVKRVLANQAPSTHDPYLPFDNQFCCDATRTFSRNAVVMCDPHILGRECMMSRALTLPPGALPGSARGVAAECADFLPAPPANLPDPGVIFQMSVAVRQFVADGRCDSSIRQYVDRPAQGARRDGPASWASH